ncbi:MAG TPA: hypothetical protein VJJ23_00225 [Candidatus Nanoarchaeia archaeon]|nr:hypothetical protein [Candidatus Nanoarchaeia archaeon]
MITIEKQSEDPIKVFERAARSKKHKFKLNVHAYKEELEERCRKSR